jgi:lipopolysaccharide export system ATP-binding protein
MALLDVRGLVKAYGRRRVVDGVSFSVNPGEVVGLLGPNGAGKTTSFRMATGQIAPNDGDVHFDGQDVTEMPMFRRARLGMGYLSQEQSVFKKLTVEENLLAILEALPQSRMLGRKLTRQERRDRTDRALKQFHLEHVRSNVAGRCSGGEKRRLEIARCLVCEPSLILLDEPFAAVDPKTTEDIRHNIRDLAKQGIGILLTDHNVREVLRIADRIYLIVNGKVVTAGTPAQLVNDPTARKEYLGSSFTADGFGGDDRPPPDRETILPMPARPYRPAGKVEPEPVPLREPDVIPVKLERRLDAPAEPLPFRGAVQELVEYETMRRAAEQLGDRATMETAWAELAAKGRAAVPVLLEMLERREVERRHVAFRLLQFITQQPLDFAADAADDVRNRQIAHLRLTLETRRAV